MTIPDPITTAMEALDAIEVLHSYARRNVATTDKLVQQHNAEMDEHMQTVSAAIRQQAARIAELETQLARAEEVIRPFAEIMNQINPPMYADNYEVWGFKAKHLMWGDFNRAAQWIKERKG